MVQADGRIVIRARILDNPKPVIQEFDPGYYSWSIVEFSRYKDRDILEEVSVSYNNDELGVTFTSRYDKDLNPLE